MGGYAEDINRNNFCEVNKDAVLTVVSANYKRNNRKYYSIVFTIDGMEADFRYCANKNNGFVYIFSVDDSFKPYKKCLDTPLNFKDLTYLLMGLFNLDIL